MKLFVRYFAMVREKAGIKEESFSMPNGSTMRDLLDAIIVRHEFLNDYIIDENGIRDYLVFSVNNVDIFSLKGFETILKNGDQIFLMPPIGGGLSI